MVMSDDPDRIMSSVLTVSLDGNLCSWSDSSSADPADEGEEDPPEEPVKFLRAPPRYLLLRVFRWFPGWGALLGLAINSFFLLFFVKNILDLPAVQMSDPWGWKGYIFLLFPLATSDWQVRHAARCISIGQNIPQKQLTQTLIMRL